MSVPPELRVLCKRLVSTPTDELPRLCPVLVSLVLRCGGPLSAVPEAKAKDKTSEAPMLVHKLRTHITTLLTGRSASGRFAAVCLIKAAIDVGGWESLRLADPWIRGLISVLQKPDSLAAKELCVVALTKIYMLLQGYPTLVREMATPTLPDYVKACLQLIKPPSSGKPLKTPTSFIDTVASSLARLLPLFPTTLRTFSAQITTALKVYVAPTTCEAAVVPRSLRESSRRVLILLHYTAPKNGNSDEWAKRIRATISDCHTTADHAFRAVQESWESTTGYRSQTVRNDVDPSGGGDAADEFPSWTGLSAGSERLVGLLEFLGDHLRVSTKNPVTVPLGELLDLVSRISLITTPSSDDLAGLNPAISRDERAELWSVLPDIHQAAISLHIAIIRRLGDNTISLSTDIIDQVVRILASDRHVPAIRESTYILLKEVLLLSGPTLPKLTVDSLTPLIHACCQDTLRPTGYSEPTPQQTPTSTTTTTTNGTTKPKDPASANADAFLAKPTDGSPTTLCTPRSPHEASAHSLLPFLLSHLPQRHLSPDSRALLDRTAILSLSKDAMLASCLHPYKDSRGRYYPSILPFLIRQYPHDQGVEVLRTNLVRSARLGAGHETLWEESPEEAAPALADDDEDTAMEDPNAAATEQQEANKPKATSGWGIPETESKMDVDSTPPEVERNAFFTTTTSTTTAVVTEDAKMETPLSPLKRKASQVGEAKTKRVDTGRAEEAVSKKEEVGGSDSEDDSDAKSIEIDPTFDDDEDEEEE
ncbi:rRNA processing/ribosome biogenesis-domain-containing protein [Cercophora newfieldiana]|uniref:Pre-rRNA-processing protein RIX1 n=1 Tax=Cercophora newfieldiana TaxID=92897 RepID=A0AA39Y826_9PEZI|nr:rRNA processing/ribosome biogenesis-domain-containing protein [Cercophora newfieldiana]